ncbi:MAG: RluA family pseudouridine synthase [Isosphaerales bacterium]
MNQHLAIVFEDDHCLALAKPAGQFTQGTWAPAGEMTLETAVRQYLDPAAPSSVYLGIVHRLDRPTSGLLLWAKTMKAARRLSAQFERRAVIKEYWGIVELTRAATASESVEGTEHVESDPAGVQVWSDWLTRANELGVASAVTAGTPGAREAVTRWRFAAATSLPPRCAWLRLWPQTGRTHQLRIQAARRGMPVVGDSSYGSSLPFPMPHGIALHSRSVRFRHPVTGIETTLVAPLPSSWAAGGMILPDPVGPATD